MTFVERFNLAWKQFKNERLYRRIATHGPVKIVNLEEATTIEGELGDWSPGGVFILTPKPFPLETTVDVEFKLGRGGHSGLHLRGQVVRHQKREDGGTLEGMGVMFTDFTQSGLLVLQEFLAKVYADTEPA